MPTVQGNFSVLDQAMGLVNKMQTNAPEPINKETQSQSAVPNIEIPPINYPQTKLSEEKNQEAVSPNAKAESKETFEDKTEASAKDRAERKIQFPNQVEREKSKVAPGYYRPVPEQTLIEWDAPARPFKERKKKFFSTVLIIAVLVSLILFFAGQILPVAVVVSVVFLVYVSAVVPPNVIHCKLTNYGLYLEKEAFAWHEMARFWFDDKAGQEVVNIDLFRLPGRLTLVIDEKITPSRLDFNLIFSEVILKEKPELTTFEKAAKWLQEKIPLE